MPKKPLQRAGTRWGRRRETPDIAPETKELPLTALPTFPDETPASGSTPRILYPPRQRWRSLVRWSMLWLSVTLILGGTGIAGIWLLTQLPPQINCREVSPLAADSERLYCVQQAAESGQLQDLLAAIALVKSWQPNHPLYPEAQRLLEQWSAAVLALAKAKLTQGNLTGAVNIASKIPANSTIYPEVQAAIATWKQQWQQAELFTRKFQEALKGQNWTLAAKQVQAISELSLEQAQIRADRLRERLIAEKQAVQQLAEAREVAKPNTPESLSEGLALLNRVSPTTYAIAQVQLQKTKWSRILVEMAKGKFKERDFEGAVAVAQRVPIDVPVYQEAQDWLRLGRASATVQKNNILTFLDALAAIAPIDAKSPVYPDASRTAALWQAQLKSLSGLEYAKAIASGAGLPIAAPGQRLSLKIAIDQAEQIPSNHPQRLQAQTLMAQWSGKIQELDDRSNFAAAKQLAGKGGLENLRAAAIRAAKIELGQPLRIPAQTAIANWTRQIEIIEDQPLLDVARSFAMQGNLLAAIQSARQIRSGRALYPDAQTAIADWMVQGQIAEDRRTLDAATMLAMQGRWLQAVQMASKIKSDRPLYSQAQTAIQEWTTQQQPGTTPSPIKIP